MLRNGRATHLEVSSKHAYRAIAIRKQVEHTSPSRVTNRPEHIGLSLGGHYHADSIGKHLLTRQAPLCVRGRVACDALPRMLNL
jgi:hypothetical protein